MDQTASFPDASPTRGPSLSLAASQRRSWLHITGMLDAQVAKMECARERSSSSLLVSEACA